MRYESTLVKTNTLEEILGNIDATITNCKFRDNVFNFNNDVAVSTSSFATCCVR